MGSILKFDIQKRKKLHFSEENYLNYTQKTQFWHFACDNYIFLKIRTNKNKQLNQLGALKQHNSRDVEFQINRSNHLDVQNNCVCYSCCLCLTVCD